MIGRALALTLALVALVPASALAHATLEETTPQRGAQLDAAPKDVVLRFSEPVEAAFGAVRVFDASGEQIQVGDVFRPGSDSKKVAVELPNDLSGGYTVTYRVISADSHPVSSGFVFTVGNGPAPAATVDELLAGSKAGSVTWNALSVARGIQYAAIALGIGSAFFLLVVWLPALSVSAGGEQEWSNASAAFARRMRTLLLVASIVGALSAAAAVVLQGAVASASSFWSALSPDTVQEILETRFGTVWGLGALAWLVLGVIVAAGLPRLTFLLPLAWLAAVPRAGRSTPRSRNRVGFSCRRTSSTSSRWEPGSEGSPCSCWRCARRRQRSVAVTGHGSWPLRCRVSRLLQESPSQ